MKMTEAAGLLGVTYSILYSKYREAFGKIGDKSEPQKCPDSDNKQDEFITDIPSDAQEERPRKRRGQHIPSQTKKKKKKIEAESDNDDDEYVPSDVDQDSVKHEDSTQEEDEEDLSVERKEAKKFSSGEKREKRKYSKRINPGPTGEELLSKETDPEVLKLQKQFSARDGNWWEPPKPCTAENTLNALREEKFVNYCATITINDDI